jgi:hypothetical protein
MPTKKYYILSSKDAKRTLGDQKTGTNDSIAYRNGTEIIVSGTGGLIDTYNSAASAASEALTPTVFTDPRQLQKGQYYIIYVTSNPKNPAKLFNAPSLGETLYASAARTCPGRTHATHPQPGTHNDLDR